MRLALAPSHEVATHSAVKEARGLVAHLARSTRSAWLAQRVVAVTDAPPPSRSTRKRLAVEICPGYA
jgi:hypothetical protein